MTQFTDSGTQRIIDSAKLKFLRKKWWEQEISNKFLIGPMIITQYTYMMNGRWEINQVGIKSWYTASNYKFRNPEINPEIYNWKIEAFGIWN